MCQQVMINGDVIDTQGALASLLGDPARLQFRPEYQGTGYTADVCLCPVDLEATLTAAGFRVRPGWDDQGVDFVAERAHG